MVFYNHMMLSKSRTRFGFSKFLLLLLELQAGKGKLSIEPSIKEFPCDTIFAIFHTVLPINGVH